MVDGQKDDGTHYGTHETGAFIGSIPADRLPNVGRHEGSHDAKQGRDDEAARVAAGARQFRDNPAQKTLKKPPQICPPGASPLPAKEVVPSVYAPGGQR